MNTSHLARGYLAKAKRRLLFIADLRREQAWDDIVRFSQEAVELALKALLRHVGVDPPKAHDVGAALRAAVDRLPPEAASRVEELALGSEALAKTRGPSFYGDETGGLPPSDLFPAAEADRAERLARDVVGVVERAVGAR